ncbi:hypothetical protein [Enterobacter kobei]|uniref:hypothetical protein n=1 Tax=Enterobacter kobei TaxID=208224 RepID=UPI002149654D|nr:hypothetical protein [Enterobacter kobei]MCR1298411.1 hypothetical protein [Enterobacter kobei]
MSTITKERLEQLANFRGAPVTRQEEQELARIALASLEAEAVASVPTFDEWLEIRGNKPLGWVKDAMRESYDACRDAMLQGGKQ